MLIVDRGANKIRKVIPGGSISTFAGSGTAGFSGDGWCDLATAQFNAPTGIASDFMGNIYVADTANNRVRVVDPQGCVATVAGTGVAGNAGASFARDAELNAPASVAVGTDLDIYVGDNSGRIIGIGTNNSFLVVAGTVSKGFSELGTATGTQIGRVVGMAVESGLLYFLDRDASRIRVTSVNSAAIAIKDARVSLIPGASGHAADQVLLTVSLSASISPRYLAFDVPGATGAPTILSSFGVAGSPSALMYGDAIAIDLGSEQSLRTNTAYAFVVSGVSFSSLAPHQIMVSCHDASLGVLAFGRSNIVRTDGPGNMPTVGQAGFASPVNASSTAVLSGPTKLRSIQVSQHQVLWLVHLQVRAISTAKVCLLLSRRCQVQRVLCRWPVHRVWHLRFWRLTAGPLEPAVEQVLVSEPLLAATLPEQVEQPSCTQVLVLDRPQVSGSTPRRITSSRPVATALRGTPRSQEAARRLTLNKGFTELP